MRRANRIDRKKKCEAGYTENRNLVKDAGREGSDLSYRPQWGHTMPDAAVFRPELFDFLRQLKRHNNREWFAKNTQRYGGGPLPGAAVHRQLRSVPAQTRPAFRRRRPPDSRLALSDIS